MDHAGTLKERYDTVCDTVARAAARSGRRASEVLVVAVGKYAEPDDIRELYDLGHRDFGENRVPQLVQRASMLGEADDRVKILPETAAAADEEGTLPGGTESRPIRWHMIGHLQRNKARKVIDHVRLIHSVDNLRLVEELQTYGFKKDRVIDVLVQVNIAGEDQKYGCLLPAAGPLVDQIESTVHVRARGLMIMAPYSDDPEQARPVFARGRELFEDIRSRGSGDGTFNILSMGMSGDYEVAIEEGANIVRVGSAIFGERPADPSVPPADEHDDATDPAEYAEID